MPYTKEGIGYQNTDTSYEATSPIKDKLILREKIYNYMVDTIVERKIHIGLSGTQIANCLNLSVLTVRPRLTELKDQRKIFPQSNRYKNPNGKTEIMYGFDEENPNEE